MCCASAAPQVVNSSGGMSVEDAYIAADCPGAHRDAALHSIRRLARQLRQQQRDTPPAVAQSAGTGSGNKRKGLGSTTSTPGASKKQRVARAPVAPSSAAAAATPSPASAAAAVDSVAKGSGDSTSENGQKLLFEV